STPLKPSNTAMKKAVLMIVPWREAGSIEARPGRARLTDSQNADLEPSPRDSDGAQVVAQVLVERLGLRSLESRCLGQRSRRNPAQCRLAGGRDGELPEVFVMTPG